MVTAIFEKLLEEFPGRLTIKTHTPVLSVRESFTSSTCSEIETDLGKITAKEVVYCTNGHTGQLLPLLRGKIFPVRGHMTVQLPGQIFPGLGAERSWNFVYGKHGLDYATQNAKTGEIFLGGGLARGQNEGLEEFGNSSDDTADVLTQIHLSGVLPVIFGPEIRYSRVKSMWTGIMGWTADGIPLVGKLPSSATGRVGQREWIAAGFNGYGMVNSWGSGKAIALMMLGEDIGDWFPASIEVTQKRLDEMQPEKFAKFILDR
jgi:glycine/D-amino acid oxidase-like deaminating enzyme